MHLLRTETKHRTLKEQKMIDETLTLLTGKSYTNAAQTNILETFRRMGWTPPSETRQGKKWLPVPTGE
jgi:hypothetical protein